MRQAIVASLANIISESFVVGSKDYSTVVYGNVIPKNVHFADVTDYPTISVASGPERYEYLPSGMVWADMTVYVRVYDSDPEDVEEKLEKAIVDLKKLLALHDNIPYTVQSPGELPTPEVAYTTQTTMLETTTDEGLLKPLGIAEMTIVIRYAQPRFL